MESETRDIAARREKVAGAGGELLGAALNLVSELIEDGSHPDPSTVNLVRAGLDRCVERDADGRPQLRFTLPDENALNGLATTLAKLLIAQKS